MMAFNKCPICGGEIVEKQVDKLLRGGSNSAVLTVQAEVCLHCGERMYSEDTIKQFEIIRSKLEKQETNGLVPVGRFFKAG
jgi:YgiT-type zinc finger domain-containing protein